MHQIKADQPLKVPFKKSLKTEKLPWSEKNCQAASGFHDIPTGVRGTKAFPFDYPV